MGEIFVHAPIGVSIPEIGAPVAREEHGIRRSLHSRDLQSAMP